MKNKILSESEIHNIMKMLNSADHDDRQVAYKLLEKINLEKNFGEILFIFSVISVNANLQINCKKVYEFLNVHVRGSNFGTSIQLKAYELIIKQGSDISKKLMIEYLNSFYKDILRTLGYPKEIEIQLKLKDNG
jgi:hypothetical protein